MWTFLSYDQRMICFSCFVITRNDPKPTLCEVDLIFVGSQLLRTTLGVKEYVGTEFRKLEQEIILPNRQLFPSHITLDDFLWAFGILRSRAFSRLRGQNLLLIPLADLVSIATFLTLINFYLLGLFLILIPVAGESHSSHQARHGTCVVLTFYFLFSVKKKEIAWSLID